MNTETFWYALNNKKTYKDVMVESAYEGIWVVPSTKELKGAQLAFGQSARGMRIFKKFLKGVAKDFDYVLIDTKPQINVYFKVLLCASQWYVIPSFPEPDSYDGFLDLVAECEEIHEEMNEDLNCLGVLMTCVKRIPAHESYLKFISKHLRKAKVPLFKQTIRSSNSIATGSLHACPAVSLPNARFIKEDYVKVVRSMIRTTSKFKGDAMRPDLEILGVIPSEEAIEASANEDFFVQNNNSNEISF